MLRVVLYVSLTSPEKDLLVDSSFTKFYLIQSYLSEQKPNNASNILTSTIFQLFSPYFLSWKGTFPNNAR